jgi:hypothetical protein
MSGRARGEHEGHRSAARISLVLADNPKRLAAAAVTQDRDPGAERDDCRIGRLRLHDCARNAFSKIARISRSRFQGATALIQVLDCLGRFEGLLAIGQGPFESAQTGLSHEVGMRGDRPRGQGHLLRRLCALLPDERNAHTIPP